MLIRVVDSTPIMSVHSYKPMYMEKETGGDDAVRLAARAIVRCGEKERSCEMI